MIKPITYQGVFNFAANLYALEVKSRFYDHAHADGYYAGYGNELDANIVGGQIQIGTGAFLVQGRMNEVTSPETVAPPALYNGFVGYVCARIETFHPSDDDNCTFVVYINHSFEELDAALQKDDVFAPDADNVNKVYELPIYSFEIAGGAIINLTKLITAIDYYATIKNTADTAYDTAANAILQSAAADSKADNAVLVANAAAAAVVQGQGTVVKRANTPLTDYDIDNVVETVDEIVIEGGGVV